VSNQISARSVAQPNERGARTSFDHTGARALLDSRILVVDDDATSRSMITLTLKKHGFWDIRTAVDGRAALAQIAAAPPDLVVLDILMPEIDGFAVCRQLRRDPRLADLPIVIQTALHSASDRVKAFECGATDFVSKPINPRELIARISIHLERRLLIESLTSYQTRIQEELRLARQMQRDLLPSTDRIGAVRDRYGVDVAGYFEPCSEIGGDLWGIRAIDDSRLGLYLLDFSGHGVGAALNTFRIQGLISELWSLAAEPSLLLENLNLRLCEVLGLGQFVTIFFAALDIGYAAIEFAAAGAPAAVLVGGIDEPPCLLDGSGLPLGLMRSASYPSRHASLPYGSSLFLVSDGVLETRDRDGAMLDAAGFGAVACRTAREGDAARVVAAVVDDFARRVAAPPEDDLTVVCLRR
jgi:sigma-B regulation protein RsbU (phosphoserine phosphatase)